MEGRETMCRLSLILNVMMAVVIAAMAYMFVLRGAVAPAGDDGRTVVLLSRGERNLVLSEMRGFLESVQEIIQAVNDNDMKSAAEAAARVGRVDLNDLPPSLLRKLPVALKQMGLATHYAFYKLSGDIGGGLKKKQIMARMADIMNNCVACHQGYRLDLESK